MKKVFSLALIAGMFAVVACGPNKADQEKAEKMKADSIRMSDSLAKVAADAAEMEAMAKMKADSTAKADSLAKAAMAAPVKGGKKK